ncbi:SIMPL domain-containing protein [Luteipulveratus flavus]|uniref:SIMPL domain-containing protein n=1 Tax=Luteipulveratus flavus TaxID=3031728 RepID=A0ABT6C417_9MICO|nr:SIMPL domain-containing protein [Luteipulveratus sp. YIM 133296]MDF8263701.1 SIMPL domain-containing protein [Luteipulveratus sp. YIM 133296]
MTAPDQSITVIGSGSAAGSPDVVRVVLAARAEARDVSVALETCQTAAQRLGATLREQGVRDADVRTLGVSVDTRWGPEAQPAGYEATHRLHVLWRDPSTVGSLLSAGAGAVGNAFRLESVQLAVEDPAALQDRARRAAYDDALRQARDLVDLAERDLGQVLAIDEPEQSNGPAPMARMAMAAGDGGVEVGQHTVQARLRVRWALG